MLAGVVSQGTSRTRRQIPASLPRMMGRWFVDRMSLCDGRNVKKSCRMKRAVMGSPPVRLLTVDSASCRPASVSDANASRRPISIARSVGCWSPPVFFIIRSAGTALE